MELEVKGTVKGDKFVLELYTSDVIPVTGLVCMLQHEVGNFYYHIDDMKAAKKRLKAIKTLMKYHGDDYSVDNEYTKNIQTIKDELDRLKEMIKAKSEEGK